MKLLYATKWSVCRAVTSPPTPCAERDVSGGGAPAQTPETSLSAGRARGARGKGLWGSGSAEVVVEPAQQPAELGDVPRGPLGQLGGDVRAAARPGALERALALAGQAQQPGPGVLRVGHALDEAEPLEVAEVAAHRRLVQLQRGADVRGAHPAGVGPGQLMHRHERGVAGRVEV